MHDARHRLAWLHHSGRSFYHTLISTTLTQRPHLAAVALRDCCCVFNLRETPRRSRSIVFHHMKKPAGQQQVRMQAAVRGILKLAEIRGRSG